MPWMAVVDDQWYESALMWLLGEYLGSQDGFTHHNYSLTTIVLIPVLDVQANLAS